MSAGVCMTDSAWRVVEQLLRARARQQSGHGARTDTLLAWLDLARPTVHGQPYGHAGIPPCLVALYQDEAPEIVVLKSAQVGVSEYLISMALWAVDTQAGDRGVGLYVFPAIAQVSDFVRARVDPAIEESAYLAARVRPVKGVLTSSSKFADNVGLKRVGKGYLYFRGSNASAGLKSVDADIVVYDEVDELRPGTLDRGAKRLGSSKLAWQRYASCPTYPERGIDALWQRSDRRRWFLRCDACGKRQYLIFPTNVREDGEVICGACHRRIDRLGHGEWVAEKPGEGLHGYHVSRLTDPRADVGRTATLGYRILKREETNQSAIQEYYNQDLGVPYSPEGGQISRGEVAACCADYSLEDWGPMAAKTGGCSMGVDVGAVLHVRVDALGPEGKPRAAYVGTVRDWQALRALMPRYDVRRCVIDAEPEHHAAREFANEFRGRVWLCNYPNTATWIHAEPAVWNDPENAVSAHRTLLLDAVAARIRERRIEYPRELLAIAGFAEQITAPIRVIERDAAGRDVARYVETGPDHYAHAEAYCLLAATRVGAAPSGVSADRAQPGGEWRPHRLGLTGRMR